MDSLKKEIENLKLEKKSLVENNETLTKNLQTMETRRVRQDDTIEKLTTHISHITDTYSVAKRMAIENIQQTMEKQCNDKIDKMKLELRSTLSELDIMKFKYVKACDDHHQRERQMKNNLVTELEEMLEEIKCNLEKDKREWECLMRDEMEKEKAEYKNSLRQTIESELKEESQRNVDIMIKRNLDQDEREWEFLMRGEKEKEEAEFKNSLRETTESELTEESQRKVDIMIKYNLEEDEREWEFLMRGEKEEAEFENSLRETTESELTEESQRKVSQTYLEEQQLITHAMIEDALAEARKQWQKEHERGIQQLAEERDVYKSMLSSNNDELSESKQKLQIAVSKMERSSLYNKTKTWLEQEVALRKYTEVEAKEFEKKIMKEFNKLKEDMHKFKSESQLKVFGESSDSTNRPSHDGPMAVTRHDEMPDLEEPLTSMKGRLSEMDSLKKRLEDVEKENVSLVENNKDRLREMDSLRKRLENKKKRNLSLVEQNEAYRRNLQAVERRRVKQEVVIEKLANHISQLENKYQQEKRTALETCQQTLEKEFKQKHDQVKNELRAAKSQLDTMRFSYAKTSDEYSRRVAELKRNCVTNLEQNLGDICTKLEEEKKEREFFMLSELDKERAELTISLRQTIESELKEVFQRNIDMMSQAKPASMEEQQLARQAMIEEALADAKKQWQKDHERDIQQLTEERGAFKSKLSCKHNELTVYKQKMQKLISEVNRHQKDHEASMKEYRKEVDMILAKSNTEMLQKSGTDNSTEAS